MPKPVMILMEDHGPDGVAWGVSIDGHNPRPGMYAACRDRDHAEHVQWNYDHGCFLPWMEALGLPTAEQPSDPDGGDVEIDVVFRSDNPGHFLRVIGMQGSQRYILASDPNPIYIPLEAARAVSQALARYVTETSPPSKGTLS